MYIFMKIFQGNFYIQLLGYLDCELLFKTVDYTDRFVLIISSGISSYIDSEMLKPNLKSKKISSIRFYVIVRTSFFHSANKYCFIITFDIYEEYPPKNKNFSLMKFSTKMLIFRDKSHLRFYKKGGERKMSKNISIPFPTFALYPSCTSFLFFRPFPPLVLSFSSSFVSYSVFASFFFSSFVPYSVFASFFSLTPFPLFPL